MLAGKGIWTSSNRLFNKSTANAGLADFSFAAINMLKDSYMRSLVPTSNFGTDIHLYIGENNVINDIGRTWVKPDLASLPGGIIIYSASLVLTVSTDLSSNARTLYMHRCLRAAIELEMTWERYSVGNNWGSGGASNSTTDYDGAVVMGTATQPASPSADSQITIELSNAGVAELQKMYDGTYTNNGLILFVDTQDADMIRYYSNVDVSRPPFMNIGYAG
jgi:hypothetical protein